MKKSPVGTKQKNTRALNAHIVSQKERKELLIMMWAVLLAILKKAVNGIISVIGLAITWKPLRVTVVKQLVNPIWEPILILICLKFKNIFKNSIVLIL